MAKEFPKTHTKEVNQLKLLALAVLIKKEPNFHKPTEYYYNQRTDLTKFKYLVPLYYKELNYIGLTSSNIKVRELTVIDKELCVGRTRITSKTTSSNYAYIESETIVVDIALITSLLTSVRTGKIKGKLVKEKTQAMVKSILTKYNLTEYVGYVETNAISKEFEKSNLLPNQTSAYWITRQYLVKTPVFASEVRFSGRYLGVDNCKLIERYTTFPWDTDKLFKETK